MFFAPTLPNLPSLIDRCQRFDTIGTHSTVERIRRRVAQGLGIKSKIRRLLIRSSEVEHRDPLGPISQFPEGSWVRVRDEASIGKTLDQQMRLRGLRFSAGQWRTCSKVYRVAKVVRRVIDNERRMRPIARTVLLDGVDCTANDDEAGCGRYCPMWYRDEWLEPSDPPLQEAASGSGVIRNVRIKSLEEILSRLDLLDRREGLTFMPEMARYAGTHARVVRQLSRVIEYNRCVKVRGRIYLLEGLHCTGGNMGSKGPCDRACRLLWHADWLEDDA